MRPAHVAVAAALAFFSAASRAWALDAPRVHGALGVAHAVGAPQDSEFGFGGQAAIAVELPLARPVGVQAELSSVVLAAGSAPSDPSLAPKTTGVGFVGS